MAIQVDVVGLKEANRALKQLPDMAKREVQKVIDVTAFQVWRGAQARVKSRTGKLVRAMRWKSRPRSVSAVVGAGPDGFYWKFLEYGTVKMEARPMFRPAALSVENNHQSRMNQALAIAARNIERVAWAA